MIPAQTLNKLAGQWGESADSLQVKALVRLWTVFGDWQCYLYAYDGDRFKCLMGCYGALEDGYITMAEIISAYDYNGEPAQIDREFRPRLAYEILKEHRERKNDYDINRT